MKDQEFLRAAAHRGRPRDPRLLYREAFDAASQASTYTQPTNAWRQRRGTRMFVAVGGVMAACVLAIVLLVGIANRSTSPRVDTVPTISTPVPTQPGVAPSTSSSTSVSTYICGDSFPLAFDTLGFTGPESGPATDSTVPPDKGQLVQHWTRGDQTFELRWPPNATPSAAQSGRPSAGFHSGNGLAGLGFDGNCANFAMRAYAAISPDAQALSERLSSSTRDAIRARVNSTVPLVQEHRTVGVLPEVISCKTEQGAVAQATTTRQVTDQAPTANPDDALRQFLGTDPLAQTFATVGYIDFTTPDGSHHYGYAVGNDEIAALIAVQPKGSGWAVTSYTSSGC